MLRVTATLTGVSTATVAFLMIGVLGFLIAAVAMFGGELLDIGDGLFSTEVLAAAVGGFGFSAAAANELLGAGAGLPLVLGVGIAAAVPMGLLAWTVVVRLSKMRTDGTPTRHSLSGARGVVVTPIPSGGFGEVRIRIGGQPVKLNARAARPLALGVPVMVTVATSDTSVIVEEITPSA